MEQVTHAQHAKDSSAAQGSRLERIRSHCKYVRPIVIFLAIPVTFCLVELPFNPNFPFMDPYYVLINLIVIGVLFSIVYGIAQRCRIAVVVFMVLFFIFGATNYYLVEFKGWPLMPADLLALSTAADVSSSYTLNITGQLVASFIILLAYCAALFLMPKVKITLRRFIVNTAVAIVLAVGFGVWMSTVDIEKAYGCTVDVWEVKDSYYEHGSLLCFLKRIQDTTPAVPDGYSEKLADELMNEALESYELNNQDKEQTHQGTSEDSELPTVVTVMNETFSDLSLFNDELLGSAVVPQTFYDIADDSLESGLLYVSAFGGSTCNSEFEFLTGATMGLLGGGVYPYEMYDLNNTNSLVSYFSTLGYATHAIHPAEATNWRRDVVYEQLGFDDFTDQSAFEDADRLRDYVTDRATYDYVLDLLEADSSPQFILDITIQNHGGYLTGDIDRDKFVSVTLPDGGEADELNEYASCIQQSCEDLSYLIDRLNETDRPIVLCFFGDHQPGFTSDWFWEVTHDGEPLSTDSIEDVQLTYSVPYFIWSNTAAREAGIAPEVAEDEIIEIEDAQILDVEGEGSELIEEAPVEGEITDENPDVQNAEGEAVGAGVGEGEGEGVNEGEGAGVGEGEAAGAGEGTNGIEDAGIRLLDDSLNGLSNTNNGNTEGNTNSDFYETYNTDTMANRLNPRAVQTFTAGYTVEEYDEFGNLEKRYIEDDAVDPMVDEGQNVEGSNGEGNIDTPGNINGEYGEENVDAPNNIGIIGIEGVDGLNGIGGTDGIAGIDDTAGIEDTEGTEGEELPDETIELTPRVFKNHTSLNYLGARLLVDIGLSPTGYQAFLLNTSESIPAINLNGFLLPDGTWHFMSEAESTFKNSDITYDLWAYSVVQYDDLFG